MPSIEEPQQQAPMEMTSTSVISQQPTSMAAPSMSLRGGEEAGCELCCGLCACNEACC